MVRESALRYAERWRAGADFVTVAMPVVGARGARAVLIECVVVAAIVFAAYAASHPDPVATLGRLYDDEVYLSVGKSIAEGHGYRSGQLVGAPVHVKFPPLLPAVYAGAWATFGSLDAVARLALWSSIVVTAVAAGTLWWLARRELGVGAAFAALFVAVPIVTDRAMFYFSGAASEPWMLLGWAVSLVLARRLTRVRVGGAPAAVAVGLGLTLAATALARTQGIAIAAGLLGGLALTRVGWRTVAVAVSATVVPLIVWRAWHGAMMNRGPLSPLPDQLGYTAWIPTTGIGTFTRFAIAMIRTSVPSYWSSAANVLVGWTSAKTLLLASAILVSGLAGTLLLVRSFPAMAGSLLATLGVIAVWPYIQDRFLTPLLPVLGVAAAFAAQRVVDRVPVAGRRAAVFGTCLLIAALLVKNGRLRIESARGSPHSPYAAAIAEMVSWVQHNTIPSDHVMVAWGGTIYLRTGRLTSIPDPEEPTIGKSVLATPYRFYATRLLADSVDVVIIWDRAPGRAAKWLRALGARCPGLMTESNNDDAASAQSRVHYYRVRRDLACVTELARVTPSQVSANTNAP